MSETITGILEEIAIVKKGTGKKGPWTLRKITVDGEKYSTFDAVKATIGSTVEFESEENDQGYKDVVRNSFVVTKEATEKQISSTKPAYSGSTGGSTNHSIESQVALKCAVEFALGSESDDKLALVSTAYRQFANLLHPTAAAPAAKPAPKKAAPKPPVHEDGDQSGEETPDY